ncbi:hypothetical protein [Streptomyces sp. NPDC047453]|uniref:hypothetical protein n=1 Tax=Streptomyces sp. NPDC047453 TaxID=3154812 RepID=UPI003402807E
MAVSAGRAAPGDLGCAALDEEEAELDGFRIVAPPLAAFSGSRQCLHRPTRGWRRFGLAVLQ